MAEVTSKSFDSPDEDRRFANHGHAEVVELNGRTVMRQIFEPGWHWKDDVGPIAGTDMCQVHHFGYCVQGRMKVTMGDGSEREFGPGQLVDIPSGHDAIVMGDEACVFIDFGDVTNYASAG